MLPLSLVQLGTFIVCTLALAFTYSYITAIPKISSGSEGDSSMTTAAAAVGKHISKAMASASSTLSSSAKIVKRPSSNRGHADHGWLNTYHTFSFASYWDPRHESFGSLRVLNEDRVAPGTGFPTHPHRDAEIFSYILSGQLTHRDSMMKRGDASSEKTATKEQFYRMERNDVQFTTGGSGIAHSEQNEHATDWVHFLQIWALPWKRGLKPTYHTSTFPESEKRLRFVPIISPLKAGINATPADEAAAIPSIPNTIPIHADLLFSAAIIPAGSQFSYTIGHCSSDNPSTNSPAPSPPPTSSLTSRKTYIHLPMTRNGKAKISLDNGREILHEGDGAYISGVNAGDVLRVESVGEVEAEVVVIDSD